MEILQGPFGWLIVFSVASVLFALAKWLFSPRAPEDDDLRARLADVTIERPKVQRRIEQKQNERRKNFQEIYGETDE